MTAPADVIERRSSFSGFVVITSEIVAVGVTIDLEGINTGKPHCFVGAQFFADAAGAVVATPTAGTVTISYKTLNSTPIFEVRPGNVIDMSSQSTFSWAGNTVHVRAVPSGITVATHYRIVVTCNET